MTGASRILRPVQGNFDCQHSFIRVCAVDPGVTTGFVSVDLPVSWREGDLYRLLSSIKDLGERAEKSALGLSEIGTNGGTEWYGCRSQELHGNESGQIDSMEGVILGKRGRYLPASVVVIEDFILRERTQSRQLLAPVRVSARLEDRLHSHGYKGEIVYQTPSDAKSIVTDERLKAWGLWHSGSPHIRDAWRHLVKYLRDNRET